MEQPDMLTITATEREREIIVSYLLFKTPLSSMTCTKESSVTSGLWNVLRRKGSFHCECPVERQK